MAAKYPRVKVKLLGTDGNAFALLGKCTAAARRAGMPADRIKEFTAEATSSDYAHLLATCCIWFEVH